MRVTQKGLIQKLIRMNLDLEDVLSIEQKQREQRMMIKIKDQRMINHLMRRKLQDAIAVENKMRSEYRNNKTEMYDFIDRRSNVAKKFRKLQSEIIFKLFDNNIKNNDKKIKNLKLVQNLPSTDSSEVGTNVEKESEMFGVKVNDKDLEDFVQKPANVWGGAELTEKEEAVLQHGKKHRINTRLDNLSNQTEVEKALTNIRYQAMSENEEGNNDTDKLLNDKTNENFLNKNINLSTIRVTDLKYNRRNYAPKAASHKLETNLQQTKSALIDTFDQYTKKHCDKNGDLKNSNMDADFKEGLKGL